MKISQYSKTTIPHSNINKRSSEIKNLTAERNESKHILTCFSILMSSSVSLNRHCCKHYCNLGCRSNKAHIDSLIINTEVRPKQIYNSFTKANSPHKHRLDFNNINLYSFLFFFIIYVSIPSFP